MFLTETKVHNVRVSVLFTENYIPGNSLSVALRELLLGGRREGSIYIYMVLAREYMWSVIHLSKRSLLVSRNRYLN